MGLTQYLAAFLLDRQIISVVISAKFCSQETTQIKATDLLIMPRVGSLNSHTLIQVDEEVFLKNFKNCWAKKIAEGQL